MTKKSFTQSSRLVSANQKVKKFWKKVKSKKRRQQSNDNIAAFERCYTSAHDIS
jgi:hypothetical protein